MDSDHPLTIGQCATLACLIEVSVPKPGNVHRGADFDDLTFHDFVAAAVAIGPAMDEARRAGVGATVLEAIRATRRIADTNVNLGIALLLAPLAVAAHGETPLRTGVAEVLQKLTPDHARFVYEAIRLAQPGGMGRVPEADVTGSPPDDLLHAMRLAADRDTIARQYVTDFRDVFDFVVPQLQSELAAGRRLGDAVIHTHLRTMAEIPDTLIARKCGRPAAEEAATYARQVLEARAAGEEEYHEALADFDFWLRSDGHRRNPGTTADLIVAALFVGLRDRMIQLPLKI